MAAQFKAITLFVAADIYAHLAKLAEAAGNTVPETVDQLLEAIVEDDRACHEQMEAAE